MSSEEAKLEQINVFLGGGIVSLLKSGNAKLFFESNAEAKKDDKTRKMCIVYIIGEYVLICRPRKYGKKYYVKYQLPIINIHLGNDFSKQSSSDSPNDASSRDSSAPIVISSRDRFNAVSSYYIW